MEQYLLEKLSKITEEEEGLLSGANINLGDYTAKGGTEIKIEKLSRDIPSISFRTHTRFASFPHHSHNYIEMAIVVKGSLTHVIEDKRITLGVGDILIMNKHVCHSIEKADEGDLGINFIITDGFFNSIVHEFNNSAFSDFAKDNSSKSGSGRFLHFSAGGEKQIENIIENLIFELADYTPDISIVTKTVALLFKYLSIKERNLLVGATDSVSDKRSKAIIEYIENNYAEASLAELSDRMGVTIPYLSNLIKKIFNKNFKALLFDERLRRALILVKETELPISAIAKNIGYENDSYFYREFKNHIGKTPLEIRKSKSD